MAAEYRVL